MAKAINKPQAPPPPVQIKAPVNSDPDELVIKEIMIQKNVSREKALEILKNPTK